MMIREINWHKNIDCCGQLTAYEDNKTAVSAGQKVLSARMSSLTCKKKSLCKTRKQRSEF